jgi:hypothetical protein
MERQTGGQTHMQSEKEHFCFTEHAWDKNKYTVMVGNLLTERDIFKLWTGFIWVKTWTNGQLL